MLYRSPVSEINPSPEDNQFGVKFSASPVLPPRNTLASLVGGKKGCEVLHIL